jgi:DNA-binding PadR family transcriptional regulator
MENAGLVKKNDTGHKWIYYEITEKGKCMITSKMPVSIILTLSLGIGLILFGGMNFFATNFIYAGSQSAAMQSALEKSAEITEHVTSPAAAAPATSWMPLVMLAVGILLTVYGFIRLRRK